MSEDDNITEAIKDEIAGKIAEDAPMSSNEARARFTEAAMSETDQERLKQIKFEAHYNGDCSPLDTKWLISKLEASERARCEVSRLRELCDLNTTNYIALEERYKESERARCKAEQERDKQSELCLRAMACSKNQREKLSEAKERISALEQDAGRWRWLRQHIKVIQIPSDDREPNSAYTIPNLEKAVDQQIDAARLRAEQEKQG